MNSSHPLERGIRRAGWLSLTVLICASQGGARAVGAEAPSTQPLCISGIYPHLAAFNQPEDPSQRDKQQECGIGAMAVWAGRLWFLTYPPHQTAGSNDKLYEVTPDLSLIIRPESVGGTHAARMIHKESNQLILGPYFIDGNGHVRAVDLQKLRGRMTAVMRHLQDPVNWVYYYDMEGALYEVEVQTLDVRKLFTKPVPGFHGKGGYTAQGRVVLANNGEHGNPAAYKHLKVGGPARGEEAGVLAEWDGHDWRIVERKQFCDVTGPGGLWGSPETNAPLWAIGWDKRSVILKLLDAGRWQTFRLPKASHTFDARHGWYTEWPRIREIAPRQLMMCMHGAMYEFPIGFRAGHTGGLRPICTHLRYIPDFCYWRDRIVLGADDASMMHNPMCGQGQSNLWFGRRKDLDSFGPRAGWGGVWMNDPVQPGQPSDPFLLAGYNQRVLHLAHDQMTGVRFDLEIDRTGSGEWSHYTSIQVPPSGYAFHLIPPDTPGEWIRVKVDRACRATAYFHYWSPRSVTRHETRLFDALADAAKPGRAYAAGIIRPAAHNRSLQWLMQTVSAEGGVLVPLYHEVDLEGTARLVFREPPRSRTDEVNRVAAIRADFEVDAASVVVTNSSGQRYRLPKGPSAFDTTPPTGPLRSVREAVSERYLGQFHGTFYEIPRAADNTPDFERIKPICSHAKWIADWCTWRGLLVLSGTRLGAKPDSHFFANDEGAGLWFGMIDDLWKLGKPVGHGGPWHHTRVQAGKPSDPYLMTGYDKKRLIIEHDLPAALTVRIEVNFDHHGWHTYQTVIVPAGRPWEHRFPRGFHAHWVRLTADQDCTATAEFVYE